MEEVKLIINLKSALKSFFFFFSKIKAILAQNSKKTHRILSLTWMGLPVDREDDAILSLGYCCWLLLPF